MKKLHLSRKKKYHLRRFLYGVLVFCLLAGVVTIGVNGAMLIGMRDSIVSSDDLPFTADCILVLGAGVREDGSPSSMLADRIATGVALYAAGCAPKLLMSGDHGSPDYDEVNCMKSEAVKSGVPSEDVFMDHAGFSTYDSLYRAKYIFGVQRVVIVTQEYHLYRALYLANALGLEAVGVAADQQTYAGQTIRDVREAVARVKDMLFAIWKPSASILGAEISLDGSGDVTNDTLLAQKCFEIPKWVLYHGVKNPLTANALCARLLHCR